MKTVGIKGANTVKVAFVYPGDPFGNKVGGVETFIRGFLKYAPTDFLIEFIGVTSDRLKRPARSLSRIKYGDQDVSFWPVFHEVDENAKRFFPLSLRFVFAMFLFRNKVKNRILIFNRIEPAILFLNRSNRKLLFIHNDLEKQILNEKSEVLWSLFPGLYLFFEKVIVKYMDYIYTVSEKTLRHILGRYPALSSRACFLPTWVDPSVFFPSDASKPDLKKNLLDRTEPIWILFVGRLQEQKAPERLVLAFNEFNKVNSDSRLVIVGSGNLYDKTLKLIVSLGLERKVTIIPYMPQEKLARFYNAADVLLLTSDFEGMPRCCLEALGCGLPVVTTAVGEVKRVVKNGYSGVVVESFDPREIARALGQVLNAKSAYSRTDCVNAVADYTPEHVLKPVYKKIREMSVTPP